MTRAAPEDERPATHLLWLAGAFAAYALFLTVFTLTQPVGGYAFLFVTDIMGLVAPFAAAGFALYAATRSAEQINTGWLLIGLGCLCWGIGEGAWTFYEVVLRTDVPFPSAADVGYLAMLPLVAVGIVFFASEGQRAANSRPTLDGIALVLAFAAAVWYLVLQPTYAESEASMLEKTIAGAYPIGDVIVAYALTVAVHRQWYARARGVLLVLLGGVLLLIVADVGFASLTLNERYTSSSLVNVGWPVGFVLVAYAGALGAVWQPTFVHEGDVGTERRLAQSILVVLIPAMAFLDLVAWQNKGWQTTVPLLAMTGLATAAIVVRQLINFGLLEDFERARESKLAWLNDKLRAA